jgi:superoxide reductase
MAELSERIQTADWQKEKHVPIIECPATVKKDEFFAVKATLGKAVAHPNTTEHHIRWIELYFQPEGEKSTYQVGRFEFSAHGESVPGPNQGPVYTHHEVTASMKTAKGGVLYALSYCNLHGLWQSSKAIAVS